MFLFWSNMKKNFVQKWVFRFSRGKASFLINNIIKYIKYIPSYFCSNRFTVCYSPDTRILESRKIPRLLIMAKGGSREKAKSLCDKQKDCSFRDHGCSLLEHHRKTRPRGEQTSPWIFNSIVHRPLFKLARHDLWCKFDASQRWNGRKEIVGNSCLATLCRRFFSTRLSTNFLR